MDRPTARHRVLATVGSVVLEALDGDGHPAALGTVEVAAEVDENGNGRDALERAAVSNVEKYGALLGGAAAAASGLVSHAAVAERAVEVLYAAMQDAATAVGATPDRVYARVAGAARGSTEANDGSVVPGDGPSFHAIHAPADFDYAEIGRLARSDPLGRAVFCCTSQRDPADGSWGGGRQRIRTTMTLEEVPPGNVSVTVCVPGNDPKTYITEFWAPAPVDESSTWKEDSVGPLEESRGAFGGSAFDPTTWVTVRRSLTHGERTVTPSFVSSRDPPRTTAYENGGRGDPSSRGDDRL